MPLLRFDVPLVTAVALGGVVGAECRYALGVGFPTAAGGVPWTTLVINVTGCLLLGALMTVLLAMTRPHRLLRPFLGVGVLGGYTTFSTATAEELSLLRAGRADVAIGYLGATLVTALAATVAGTWLAGALLPRRGGRR